MVDIKIKCSCGWEFVGADLTEYGSNVSDLRKAAQVAHEQHVTICPQAVVIEPRPLRDLPALAIERGR